MKRWLILIAIFLPAGVIVHVAVVSVCAYRNGLYSNEWHPVTVPEDNTFWLERRPHEWERGMLFGVSRSRGLGRTLTMARGNARPPERVTPPYVMTAASSGPQFGREVVLAHKAFILEAEFGWPLRSFGWTMVTSGTYSHRSPTITLSGRVLPLLPMWIGFAVNTLFYPVVLWLLIPGPFVLRRFIRVRHGLCTACAYPRGESDVCSECGKAVPMRATMAT